ncbi:hypothetical protein [Halosimplex pelagicum]|uniref:Uncharacterized protein n=1 Tax=Halosimplex pelagicum TaxID=869886 RepID=A0A7D5P3X8_9EURY|nr:hypothetical protein [Halosimplex pelagicum]QLH80303.1 hypothetical protein HZS54_01090 [Halosimplex pelagicum]
MDDALRRRLNAILGLSILAVSLLLGLVLGRTRQDELFLAAGSLVVLVSVAIALALARSNPPGEVDGG